MVAGQPWRYSCSFAHVIVILGVFAFALASPFAFRAAFRAALPAALR
jgi:hypothetical protein